MSAPPSAPPPPPARGPRSALEPFVAAHRIAFSPLTFQAARIARDRGVLATLEKARKEGATAEAVAAATGFSLYAARVLLEGCLTLDLVKQVDEKLVFALTPAGRVFLRDPVVAFNLHFVNDVCYRGAADLERSLDEGRPVGLEAFGPWSTIYEGLAQLPENVRTSWFGLDHGYSDAVFPKLAPIILASANAVASGGSPTPRRLLDVGGNTGKWALLCTEVDASVEVTILDHPGQLAVALANAEAVGRGDRVKGHGLDLLDHARPFPTGFDVVWMSQFLDCFPESDIVALLSRGREALAPNGTLYVLESYWDRQSNEVGRNIVAALSLYFTCMANGTSRMYHSDDLRRCVRDAGLVIVEETELGTHTLFACRPANASDP